jgi:RHS repeat-associated protein
MIYHGKYSECQEMYFYFTKGVTSFHHQAPPPNGGGWEGADWYDFEARNYDPQIGRWHVPDPVAQYPSPYIGMGNNPVSLIDPDGLAAVWSWEDETTLWFTRVNDDHIYSRRVPMKDNSEITNKSSDQLVMQMREAIGISGGSPFGDWKAEKIAMFYYNQEQKRLDAAKKDAEKNKSDPSPVHDAGNDVNADLAKIADASKTGLSFEGYGGDGVKKSFPDFSTLWNNYPQDANGEHAHPSSDPYANQCAIRVGYAFMNSGIDMSSYPEVNKTSDGYPRSSKNLADWTWQNFGMPKIMSVEDFQNNYSGQTGLIFENANPGYTSHIDLWNAGVTGSGFYTVSYKEIWFWPIK